VEKSKGTISLTEERKVPLIEKFTLSSAALLLSENRREPSLKEPLWSWILPLLRRLPPIRKLVLSLPPLYERLALVVCAWLPIKSFLKSVKRVSGQVPLTSRSAAPAVRPSFLSASLRSIRYCCVFSSLGSEPSTVTPV